MPLLRVDETIFSWLSRYAEPFHPKDLGNTAKGSRGASKAVLSTFYEGERPTLLEDFPRGLSGLAARVPGGYWTPDVLVEKHTALPYYSRFLSVGQYTALKASMVGDVRTAVRRGVIGQARAASRAATLAYCEECVAQDLQDSRGPPSWRRLHQLPGIFVCPEHRTALKLSTVPVSGLRRLVCCPGPATGGERRLPLSPAMALQLAEDTRWLLSNPGPQLGAAPFKTAMHDLLRDRGLRKTSIVSPRLRDIVTTAFGNSGLQAIGLPCRPPGNRWYRYIFCSSTDERPGPPLQWLVLLATLEVPIQDFVCMVEDAATRPPRQSSHNQVAIAARMPWKSALRRPKRSDEELVAALQAAKQRFLKEPGWPQRAAATRLLKLAGSSYGRKGLSRCRPLVAVALAALVETELDIISRRLLFRARQALHEGSCPSLSVFSEKLYAWNHPRRSDLQDVARVVHEALVAAMARVPRQTMDNVLESLAVAAADRCRAAAGRATDPGQVPDLVWRG